MTECRAFNTTVALKDILCASYKPKEQHRVGLRETGAKLAGDPDDTQNAARRRVDVTVNGRVVMKLRGEGAGG